MAEKQNRIIQLDLLRAVAILLVLGRHFVVPMRGAGILEPIATWWERFGWTGVDLFFVLSGFLIGGLLYEEIRTTSRLNLGRFLIRRGFKIWPSYYVFILFLLIGSFWIAPLHRGDPGTLLGKIKALGPHLFHLQNYQGPVWLHTWSLAVEEHFYLAFPTLLLLMTRFRRVPGPPAAWQVGLLTTLAVVGCTYLRVSSHPRPPIDFTKVLVPTHLRIDGLLFGTTLAYVYHVKSAWFARLKPWRWPLFALGLLAVSPMMVLPLDTSPFVCTWGFTLLYLGYGAIIVAVMSIDPASRPMQWLARRLATRVLLVIGVSSYSIYLWHWNLARLPLQLYAARHPLAGRPEWNWLVYTTIYVVLATVIGYITGRLIEVPALRLRDRLFPRVAKRRERPAPAPTPTA